MAAPEFVTAADVRGYLNTAVMTGQFSNESLGSNVRAASGYLQSRTGRQFAPLATTTKLFTTEGRTYLTIPDLRTTTSVTLNGVALVANTGYYLIPDRQNPTIFTGIQFRAFNPPGAPGGRKQNWWHGHPDWFDRGYDLPNRRGWADESSLPNDLAIGPGEWGWNPYPDELLHATKVLAAFYAKRPDSVLADVEITPEGGARYFRGLPLEIREFITDWALGEQVVSVG